ncbi:hypothetical protein JCM11491_007089 [Sporobolomyces phaffii]
MSQLLVSRCFCYSRTSESDGSSALVAIIPCGHVHHKACLATWWKTKKTCPSCNQTVPVSRHNPGTLDLFGLNPYHASSSSSSSAAAAGPSSDDAMASQDTQMLVERYHREGKDRHNHARGKRVVHDDEDDDDDGDDRRVDDLKGQLAVALRDVEGYRTHGTDLEERLTEMEGENEALRNENEGLKEELAGLDADVLEELQELNERIEEENEQKSREIEKLKVKLDQRDRKSNERKNQIRVLESQLANEGDSGRRKIEDLEAQIDELDRKLMHVRGERDKLEDDREEVRDRAERKIEACKIEAKERIVKAEMLTKHAVEDLKKEQSHAAAIKSGLRSYEQKYKKLQKKFKQLQDKKQKLVVESDSDSDGSMVAPPQRLETRAGSGRMPFDPLVGGSNLPGFLSSSPAHAQAFKIKNNAALRSPASKMTRGVSIEPRAVKRDHDDDGVSLGTRGREGENSDSDDDIEIIEPTPSTSSRPGLSSTSSWSTRRPLDFVDEEAAPVASKYFTSAACAASVDRNPFPTLMDTSRGGGDSKTHGGDKTVLGKRPFERSKSDKHLPDFARDALVQTGPKLKARRRG